jgi:hypothetical protein
MTAIPLSSTLLSNLAAQNALIAEITSSANTAIEEMEADLIEMNAPESPEKSATPQKLSSVVQDLPDSMNNPVTKSLFSWLGRMKIIQVRPDRLRIILSNGYLIAEVLSKFFPAQISTHSYDKAVSKDAKADNWKQLTKFFAKNSPAKQQVLRPADIELLTNPASGPQADDAGVHVLLDVYRFLFRAKLVPKLSTWMGAAEKKGAIKMMQAGAEQSDKMKALKEEKKKQKALQPKELTKKEKIEEEKRQKMVGYRLCVSLLSKISNAIAKSPKFSNRAAGGFGAKTSINVSKIFNVFDMDMTKDIDALEFSKVIRKDLKISRSEISDEDLTSVFGLIDKDGSGSITLEEFASYSREAQKELKKNPFDEAELESENKRRIAKEKEERDKIKQHLVEEKEKKEEEEKQRALSTPLNEGKKSRASSHEQARSTPGKKQPQRASPTGGRHTPSPTKNIEEKPEVEESPAPLEIDRAEIFRQNKAAQAQQQRRRTVRQQQLSPAKNRGADGQNLMKGLPGKKRGDEGVDPNRIGVAEKTTKAASHGSMEKRSIIDARNEKEKKEMMKDLNAKRAKRMDEIARVEKEGESHVSEKRRSHAGKAKPGNARGHVVTREATKPAAKPSRPTALPPKMSKAGDAALMSPRSRKLQQQPPDQRNERGQHQSKERVRPDQKKEQHQEQHSKLPMSPRHKKLQEQQHAPAPRHQPHVPPPRYQPDRPAGGAHSPVRPPRKIAVNAHAENDGVADNDGAVPKQANVAKANTAKAGAAKPGVHKVGANAHSTHQTGSAPVSKNRKKPESPMEELTHLQKQKLQQQKQQAAQRNNKKRHHEPGKRETINGYSGGAKFDPRHQMPKLAKAAAMRQQRQLAQQQQSTILEEGSITSDLTNTQAEILSDEVGEEEDDFEGDEEEEEEMSHSLMRQPQHMNLDHEPVDSPSSVDQQEQDETETDRSGVDSPEQLFMNPPYGYGMQQQMPMKQMDPQMQQMNLQMQQMNPQMQQLYAQMQQQQQQWQQQIMFMQQEQAQQQAQAQQQMQQFGQMQYGQQQDDQMQPQAGLGGVPGQMQYQGYAAPYLNTNMYDMYAQGGVVGGQYASGSSGFVAGIPVLHQLKTPRDPTQRLSGIDINAQQMRASPDGGMSSQAPPSGGSPQQQL